MPRPARVNLFTLFVVITMASACGTTPGKSIIKTAHSADSAAPFNNVLVISVAGNISSRVQFEQDLVTALSGDEARATAYYTVVGRNPQLARPILNSVVTAREIDAIILTRMKGQDRADLIPGRPTGRLFDLYLYDYDELNIPASIPLGSTVSFVVEVYDVGARKKIWAIESLIFETEALDAVIADQAAAIAAEIRKDGLVQQ